VFILWFCWFGFNGGSTTAMSTDADMTAASMVMVNTNIAAAMAATATMIVTRIRYKKPDVSMTLNGALAGLVGITAGCDVVNPFGAAAIGLIAGTLVVFAVEFIEKVLKVDDPVGAVAVHGACGASGTLLTGLFSTSEGLLYGHGARFLGVQALGVASVIAWVGVTVTVVFLIIKHTVGLRVTKTEEVEGLDIHEHGLSSSYADFMPFEMGPQSGEGSSSNAPEQPVVRQTPLPEVGATAAGTYGLISKVSIVFNESRFEELKEALNQIGITGMTVSKVMGCGVQKGSTKLYRGAPVDINLLPKLRAEVVVANVPVDTVIETAKKVLQTGEIGDGKIFVYDVENVVKVRTGEEGVQALRNWE
jgi:Amt family ammonium transporter